MVEMWESPRTAEGRPLLDLDPDPREEAGLHERFDSECTRSGGLSLLGPTRTRLARMCRMPSCSDEHNVLRMLPLYDMHAGKRADALSCAARMSACSALALGSSLNRRRDAVAARC